MNQSERAYVRQALAYVSNVPFLLRERDRGRLADEGAIWAECQRAIETLEAALQPAKEPATAAMDKTG